jgi:hypothetical protein
MKRPLKSRVLVLVAFTLLAGETALYSQAQTQDQAARPARSRADETLEIWNAIGNKLVAMAEDFPEEKYDFKLQRDERTFAENLLHVAAVDYDLMRAASSVERQLNTIEKLVMEAADAMPEDKFNFLLKA